MGHVQKLKGKQKVVSEVKERGSRDIESHILFQQGGSHCPELWFLLCPKAGLVHVMGRWTDEGLGLKKLGLTSEADSCQVSRKQQYRWTDYISRLIWHHTSENRWKRPIWEDKEWEKSLKLHPLTSCTSVLNKPFSVLTASEECFGACTLMPEPPDSCQAIFISLLSTRPSLSMNQNVPIFCSTDLIAPGKLTM